MIPILLSFYLYIVAQKDYQATNVQSEVEFVLAHHFRIEVYHLFDIETIKS